MPWVDPAVATIAILALAVAGFVSNRVPIPVVALCVPLALWITGTLPLADALAGFSDPIVLFIASLFVLSEALEATGVTAWIGRRIEHGAALGRARLLAVLMGVVALLAAVISINGAVAAMLPVAVVVARRTGLVPSRALIPIAFAASAGSLLTLTGTPVNVIVSEAAAAAGGREFGYVEFAIVGLPLTLATAALVVLLGDRLLPAREPERLAEAAADPHDRVESWRESYAVQLDEQRLFSDRVGVAEVLIAPRSTLVGRVVCPGMTTRDENLVVLALRRGAPQLAEADAPARGSLRLQPGDAVLVQGPWDALHRYTSSPDVIAIDSSQSLQRGTPLGRGWRRGLVVLGGAIIALATGAIPPVVVGLAAAVALVLLRVVSAPQAFRAISWSTVLLIAALIPLSTAFVDSGAAGIAADLLLGLVGDGSPHVALLVVCLMTLVLGQFISNIATVLVMIPIAVSLAAQLGVSPQPFMMALTVVGAAAFLTPIATPVNAMVMQPGGYRFGDYWRLGLPLAVLFLVAAVVYVPLVWGF